MIRMGVIGYGYWGPNIVRNFMNAEGAGVAAICDIHPNARTKAGKAWPGMKIYDDCDRLIQATDVDAVAVVTPSTPITNWPGRPWKTANTSSSKNPSRPLSGRRKN
jgi:predicted dehydrogenase